MEKFDLNTALGRFEKDIDDAMGSAELIEIYCYNAKEIARGYRELERSHAELREENDHLRGAFGVGERWLREIAHCFDTNALRHMPDAVWAVRIANDALKEMRYYKSRARAALASQGNTEPLSRLAEITATDLCDKTLPPHTERGGQDG